jgi:predicted nucleic acid-binding protein
MMVVVDTNVLVSAVLLNRESNAVISFIIVDPNTAWVASTGLIDRGRRWAQRSRFRVSVHL